MISFKNLQLINPIIRAVTEAGYSRPSELQNAAIPVILERKDLLAYAPKGSGKKTAFLLPILQLMGRNPTLHTQIRVLIIAPNEQMTVEIQEKINLYSKYLALFQFRISDEESDERHIATFRKRIDIVIATPKSLLEIAEKQNVNFSKLEILVLSDADKMPENILSEKIQKLIPKNIQTLIFCTEISENLRKYFSFFLRNPINIAIDKSLVSIKSISQCVYFVEKRDKPEFLIDVLRSNKVKRFLVFIHSKYMAAELQQQLKKAGINTGSIHGNNTQIAKNNILEDFKNRKIQILITTDIAVKGIDFDYLLHIINYDLPDIPQIYIQRIERIRRLGNEGSLVSLCTADQHMDLKNIQAQIGFPIPVGTF